MVLRLRKAAANSKGERRNEGCDIPADNHDPDVGLIEDIKFLQYNLLYGLSELLALARSSSLCFLNLLNFAAILV
jgi:hypothetical protein